MSKSKKSASATCSSGWGVSRELLGVGRNFLKKFIVDSEAARLWPAAMWTFSRLIRIRSTSGLPRRKFFTQWRKAQQQVPDFGTRQASGVVRTVIIGAFPGRLCGFKVGPVIQLPTVHSDTQVIPQVF